MVSTFNGIGAVFVLAPIRPVFTGVDGTLDVAIVMELALHVHGRLVEGSALLVQGFAARFQQIKDFIDMLGLIGLIHEELFRSSMVMPAFLKQQIARRRSIWQSSYMRWPVSVRSTLVSNP